MLSKNSFINKNGKWGRRHRRRAGRNSFTCNCITGTRRQAFRPSCARLLFSPHKDSFCRPLKTEIYLNCISHSPISRNWICFCRSFLLLFLERRIKDKHKLPFFITLIKTIVCYILMSLEFEKTSSFCWSSKSG